MNENKVETLESFVSNIIEAEKGELEEKRIYGYIARWEEEDPRWNLFLMINDNGTMGCYGNYPLNITSMDDFINVLNLFSQQKRKLIINTQSYFANGRHEKISSYNIERETFIVVDPPSEDYPLYLIAYFEDMGYCVYKELEEIEQKTTVKSIEKMMGFNKKNSMKHIPKDRIIIDVSYPDSYECKYLSKKFFLLQSNLITSMECIDVIYSMWKSYERAMSSLNKIVGQDK